ncbi:SMP-30/gluconolactonase/LRE family protein [Paracoccus sp. (in: a-proteobacteria)]|uniref:SMP-30/gluconolactonase/LRE family protein n=1 Tax=Paracoccus sp. TaxID=267 RepID=UPI0028A1B8E6|nr:SMP-30/gluconolactonase/LRE family protein [Paracoccus sp. (in: a-proteobacteria)]
MTVAVFDDRVCQLGEGAFWHPTRNQPFWFDILGHRLHSIEDGQPRTWQFSEHVSAAGWIDHDRLMIASETAIFTFDLRDGTRRDLVPLEAELSENRSNDGRADPQGGFWIGTMARNAATGAGSIYRFYKNELRKLHGQISIPNAICFSPDGKQVYFADTARQIVWRQALDPQGWPLGDPAVFLDLSAQDLNPDGAVTDAEGRFWCAQWGAGQLACYGADGTLLQTIAIDAQQVTCPAFIGPQLDQIMVTSAAVGLKGAGDGKTWTITQPGLRGLPAPSIRITT